jgi:hypothetical protein
MTVRVQTRTMMDIPIDSLIPTPPETARGKFDRGEFNERIDAFFGIGRDSDHLGEDDYGIIDFYSLDEQFSKRVAGRHNKNVLFVLFGEMGSGKSMALLSLALSCARWLAAIIGGKESDYFTFDNVAIIDPDTLSEKLENLKKWNIYILDDFGAAFDARSFMSKDNKSLSHILQTCRTTNNIILVSAPHGALLDVNIHRLSMWYSEVSESHHDEGITFVKVMKVVQMFREGKIRRVYQTKKNVTAIRYYVGLPPSEFKDRYDVVRDANAKALAHKKKDKEMEEAMKMKAPSEKPGAKDRFEADVFKSHMELLVKEKIPTTMELVANSLKTDTTTLRKYMKKYGFALQKIPKTKTGTIVKN